MPNCKLRVSSSASRWIAVPSFSWSLDIGKSPSTLIALRTSRAPQSGYGRQSSNSQEMAQKVVLGIGGE
jgi:hypothetical protein